MRVALYARVSTSEQTVEPQTHALRAYAEARGLEVAEASGDRHLYASGSGALP